VAAGTALMVLLTVALVVLSVTGALGAGPSHSGIKFV
jgi:hypothetical protein